jgi:hypothetical protein
MAMKSSYTTRWDTIHQPQFLKWHRENCFKQ